MNGIHFDLSTNNLYIAILNAQSINVYHSNDEITFNNTANVITSYNLFSITINNNKIYTGTNDGTILVYDKTNYALIQIMADMCTSSIRSIKFDFNGNMIYSCFNPPMVKIIGMTCINSTLLLNGTLSEVSETYIDSNDRLWIGGNNGSVVYS
jgi:ligand-binding sensor domain-containing protein